MINQRNHFSRIIFTSLFVLLSFGQCNLTTAEENNAETFKRNTKEIIQQRGRLHREKLGFVPGQLIIKFKDQSLAGQMADDLIQTGGLFEDMSVQTDLDHLNRKYRVKRMKSLWRQSKKQNLNRQKNTSKNKNFLKRLKKKAKRRFPGDVQKQKTFVQKRFQKRMANKANQLKSVYLVELEEQADIFEACEKYHNDPEVEYAQPNYTMKLNFTPTDPFYNSSNSWGQGYDDLWGLKSMNMEQAWDVSIGDGIVVAVVDTGLDLGHPDIVDNIWTNPGEIPGNGIDDDQNGFIDDVNGWNFFAGTNSPQDDNGHGSHVSGTIAATNNNIGIIGVSHASKIMPLKIFAADGSATTSGIVIAMQYAADNGADVMNNSWGCSTPCPTNPTIEDAVRYATNLGVIVVFSAGNEGSDTSQFSPQNMSETITVAAHDHLDRLTNFSNTGSLVDIVAPGGESDFDSDPNTILSLQAFQTSLGPEVSPGYMRIRGTSMAAPHVSGMVALMLAVDPALNTSDIRQILKVSANPMHIDDTTLIPDAGILNANAALNIGSVLTFIISSPTAGTIIAKDQQGSIDISGTADNVGTGTDFKHYQLFYGMGTNPLVWNPIGAQITTPVNNGILGTWSLNGIDSNVYTLKLDVENIEGAIFTDKVIVTVFEKEGIQLTNDPSDQLLPAISGDLVVYSDTRDGNLDIYLYDVQSNTEHRITTNQGLQWNPDISGNHIVWSDDRNGNWDVYACTYDPATFQCPLQQITNEVAHQGRAVIDGDWIVWEDCRNDDPAISFGCSPYQVIATPNMDIYAYNLTTGVEKQVTTNLAEQYWPFVGDGKVVYEDWSNFSANVLMFDLSTNTTTAITNAFIDHFRPSISGNKIVWAHSDFLAGTSEIVVYDLTAQTQRTLTQTQSAKYYPIISGDKIVWAGANGYDCGVTTNLSCDVTIYDLQTDSKKVLSIGVSEVLTDIEGDRVVWQEFNISNSDIFYYDSNSVQTNKPPTITPLVDPTIAEGVAVQIGVVSTDPDNDPITLSAQLGSGDPLSVVSATFVDNGDGTGTFNWIAQTTQFGNPLLVNFTATDDGGLQSSESVLINVTFGSTIVKPLLGTTIGSTPVDFQWTPVPGATEYWLTISRNQGQRYDLYDVTQGLNLSATIDIPLDGAPVWVRIWWKIGGVWMSNDIQFDTINIPGSGPITESKLILPIPGMIINTSPVDFQWNAVPGASEYGLTVSRNQGHRNDIYDSSVGANTSVSIDIPLNGVPVWVGVWWKKDGVWKSNDFQFDAENIPGPATESNITLPTPGTIIGTTPVDFGWNAVPGATEYWLSVSYNKGQRFDIYEASQGTNTSVTVDVPLGGSSIWVRIWWKDASGWDSNHFEFFTQ